MNECMSTDKRMDDMRPIFLPGEHDDRCLMTRDDQLILMAGFTVGGDRK